MNEQISDDDEKYIPAGLANCQDNKLKPDLIEEFYKPAPIPLLTDVSQQPKAGSTEDLIELTVKPAQPPKQPLQSLEIPKYPSMAASAPISPSDILRSMPSPLMYQRPPINYAMSSLSYSVGVSRPHVPYSMPPSPILPIWPGYIMMPVPPHCYPIVPQMMPMNVLPQTPPPITERVSSPEIDVEVLSESSVSDEKRTNKMVPLRKRKIHIELDGNADRECERPEKIDVKQKDVFVIRLKDVDSFDRSNEIWRVDNNVLIQKFTGVPSLRAPARQFQSTNRMCGYDRRADWRFFVIDSHNVEYDRFSHEITVHRFPTLEMLREAKILAEKKDETFKDTEMTEYRDKLLEMEQKKEDRKKEKARRKFERIQKRMKRKLDVNSNYEDTPNRNKVAYKWPKKCDKKVKDEIAEICQDVLELIVDQVVAQFEEVLDSEESEYSDEDLEGYDCTDDEYCEQEEQYPLFDQEDVPEVGLEMTIGSIPNTV